MIATHLLEKLVSDPSAVCRQDSSRCLRMRFSESGCACCQRVCPANAIDFTDGLTVSIDRCLGCLTCTTACPTGALEADEEFTTILNALAAHRLPVFVIGCRLTSSQSHKHLPCLGMLSAEHLMGLYAAGSATVQLAAVGCSGCVAGAKMEDLAVRLREAGRVTGLPLNRRIHLVQKEEELDFQEEGLDRRSFFSSLRRSAFLGVAEALVPATNESPKNCYSDKSLPARRAILLKAIDSLPDAEATAVRNAFTFSVSFNSSCDGCSGCARVCPTGAITEAENSYPGFDAPRCTGCGLCAEFCLSGAIEIKRPAAI